METTVITNKQGFTLIEFLVAIVIISVALLGLLQAVNYAIVNNMTNQLRQEGYMLADERMSQEKSKIFTQISSPKTSGATAARLVSGAFRNYSVIKTNSTVTTNTKQVDLRVSWKYKKNPYNHSITSLVSQDQ